MSFGQGMFFGSPSGRTRRGSGPLPTERGRIDSVMLLRGGQVVTTDLTRRDTRLPEVRVQSGDQIIVQRRSTVMRDIVPPMPAIIGAPAAILIATLN